MTKVFTKRDVLRGAAAGASFLTVAGAAPNLFANQRRRAEIAVFDSRIAESAAFAGNARAAGARLFDIALEDSQMWRGVRAGFERKPGAVLIGVTSWSDWTALRGAYEAQGWRMRREVRLDCRAGGRAACGALDLLARSDSARFERAVLQGASQNGTLFAWVMA